MAWVVKSWKTERVAALAAEAVDAAAQVRNDAERDARRLRRAAGREAADATAYLLALEEFGVQTREAVRRRRRGGSESGHSEAARRMESGPTEPARRAESRPSDAPAPRVGRATLHDSPLAELFRATSSR